MKTKVQSLLIVLACLANGLQLFGQGTSFTYSGQLQDHGSPANGTYDLVFALYDASQAGSQAGLAETNYTVAVTNGLFTTTLDFGGLPFNGQLLWLDLSVRTNGGTIYTGLTPRQQVTPTPYAIYAENVSAAAISGTIQPASLAGTYGNAITMNNAGNSFSGSGSGLTGVNALALNGLNATNFWQLAGNTVLPGQFLGSTNKQSLELRVGNQRGLLITTNYSDSPNLVGGSPANLVDAGVRGAVIAGGGTTNYLLAASSNHINLSADFSSIGGGSGNTIQSGADHSLIGGGLNNVIGITGEFSVIGGGLFNTNMPLYGVIVGGGNNAIQGLSSEAFLGGGTRNSIQASAPNSTLVGGFYNSIQQGDLDAFLGGGFTNTIQTNSGYAVLVGGKGNSLNGDNSVLVGGEGNLLLQNAHDSFLGGGRNNTNTAAYAFLGGGNGNAIQRDSDNSFLGGGAGNFIGTNASSSTIGGGTGNAIQQGAGGSVLVGGEGNLIGTNANSSTIGGGTGNAIQQGASGSVLVGGEENAIQDGASDSFIGGGAGNLIGTNAYSSTIGGGSGNWIMPDIDGDTYGSVIGGGSYNTIEGDTSSAFIGGGAGNDVGINGNFATIPGGLNNYASGQYSFAAGQDAQATNDGAFVWADSQPTPFASTNNDSFNVRAQGGVHFVTGGAGLSVDGQPVLTAGSSGAGISIQQNSSGAPNVVLGSPVNFVSSGIVGATIGGGGTTNYFGHVYSNSVTADFGTVSGGNNNISSGGFATVSGGNNNHASDSYATVGGGFTNTASSDEATVGGGAFNVASGETSTVGGGLGNIANGYVATIGGGDGNTASGFQATVGGGYNNSASGQDATVGGGDGNTASGVAAAVGGGVVNTASGEYATVGGGAFNTASDYDATVGGGDNNIASGYEAMVGGGDGNNATNLDATVSGGHLNIAGGQYSTVPGGIYNSAFGDNSFAAGTQAKAMHKGAFVWADSQPSSFASTANDQFLIRAQGGVGIDTGTTIAGSLTINTNTYLDDHAIYLRGLSGVDLNHGLGYNGQTTTNFGTGQYQIDGPALWGYSGGLLGTKNGGDHAALQWNTTSVTVNGTFNNLSDRNAKQNFTSITPEQILAKVAQLPLSEWSYKMDAATRHIGPMAQDFYATFNVGTDDRHIAPVDENGVALAAIQGLNQKVEEKEAMILEQESRIQNQGVEIQELKQNLAKLQTLVQALVEKK